jgi:hypothetical protein
MTNVFKKKEQFKIDEYLPLVFSLVFMGLQRTMTLTVSVLEPPAGAPGFDIYYQAT